MSDAAININVESLKRVELVTVSGRVDSSNASQFENDLKALTSKGRNNLVLNLAGVTYMSSAGLRTLVSALRECKKKRGDVRLSAPSDRVKEVLDLSGLYSMFTTYSTDAEAIDSFS